MPLFDAWMMVDWSASKVPTRGTNSIWIGLTRRGQPRLLANPATRSAAVDMIADLLTGQLASDRVLVGWDFPFGYPAGTAKKLRGSDWRTLWKALAETVRDCKNNDNNRFEVASQLNKCISGKAFPFWGHPRGHNYYSLGPRKPRGHQPDRISEMRLVEKRVIERRMAHPQPVWKLAYPGSVGSQALVGIPCVRTLRMDRRLMAESAIWPFETGLKAPPGSMRIVHAEIYPSLVTAPLQEHWPMDNLPKSKQGKKFWPRDAQQVAALCECFAQQDTDDGHTQLFTPANLTPEEKKHVEREEAWILGVK